MPTKPTKKDLEERLAALEAENQELKAKDPITDYVMGSHYEDAQEGSRISMGADATDKAFQQRGDQFAQGAQPWEVVNPRQDLIDKHVQPGQASRFLSPSHIDKLGMRGWEPILTKDGQQVKHANQILATMPKEKAQARKQYMQEKTRKRTQQMVSSHKEAQQQAREAGLGVGGNELDISRTRRVVETVPA